ncbi:lipopolysaccharide biosynthesis protein [Agromyces sp. NPDC056379]|uniref:lipopolysaccharide biosynthesis protein n=1 Tax=unclassified Agromyces TaxID=2639701 RepID=UPI0035E10AE5
MTKESGVSFIRNVGALLVGSGTQLVASVGGALLTTLVLPVDQRGLMVIVVTIASMVALIGAAGIGNAYRHRHPGEVDQDALSADFTTVSMVLIVVSGLGGAVACVAMAGLADARLLEWNYVLGAALAASAQVATLLVTEARFALGQFVEASRWAAASAIVGFAGVAVALAVGGDAAAVITSQACCQFVVVVAAAVASTRARALVWASTSRRRAGVLLSHGMRSLVLPVAIVVISRFDRLVVAAFDTADAVAVYALAATVVEVARLAPTAIGQLATREVATGLAWRAFRSRLLLATLAAALVGIVLVASAFLIVVPVFGIDYAESPFLAAVLLWSEVAYAVIVVANLAIIGGGWSTAALRLGIAAMGIAIPLYIAGAAIAGPFGVAWARLLVFVLIAVLMLASIRSRLARVAA